jgi:hypothetical protein
MVPAKPRPFERPITSTILAVGKLIDEHFIADVRAVSRFEQTKLLQDPRRRNAAAGFLEVTAHRFGNVLQLRRLFVHQPELHGIVNRQDPTQISFARRRMGQL